MSEAPQSRRARRTAEDGANGLAGSGDPIWQDAGAGLTGENAGLNSEGLALSRRDRRRLERMARPMETWTAEEEMIATGQIPVLTPEVIAQQERLAREKAEAAARDAYARSQEFRALAEHELGAPAHAAAPAPFEAPVPLPSPAAAVVQQAPAAPAPVYSEPPVASAPTPSLAAQMQAARAESTVQSAAPVASAPAPVASAPAPVVPDPSASPSERVYVQPYQPIMILDEDEDEDEDDDYEDTVIVPGPDQGSGRGFAGDPAVLPPPQVPAAYADAQPVLAEPVAPSVAPAVLERFAPVEPTAVPVDSALVLAPVEPESLPPRELPHETFSPASSQGAPMSAMPGEPVPAASTQEPVAVPELDPAAIAAERERVMNELFPPGSSQAALIAADPIAQAHDATKDLPAQGVGGGEPAVASPTPVASTDGADEIRRIAAEAISGIERASHVETHPAPAQDPFAAVPRIEPSLPAAAQEVAPQSAPGLAPHVTPSLEPMHEPSPSQATPTLWQQTAAQAAQQPMPWNPGQGAAAPAAQSAPAVPFGAAQSTPAPWPPVSGATQAVQPRSPWESHPLASAPAVAPAVDPNAFTPVTAPPPDFSQLINPAAAPAFGAPQAGSPFGAPVGVGGSPFAPVGGAGAVQAGPGIVAPQQAPGVAAGQGVPASSPFAPTGALAPSDPTPTGALSAVRRMEVPEKPDPRNFKWLHLGVIGALMFVLGVVIYNVMLNQ